MRHAIAYHPSLSRHLPQDLGTPQQRKRGTVPELRMVGRALGGRDPVRELLLPPVLVPPPLHVSCKEESWPGMEMDLAVDGGLSRIHRCHWGVPPQEPGRQGSHGPRKREGPCVPTPSCGPEALTS